MLGVREMAKARPLFGKDADVHRFMTTRKFTSDVETGYPLFDRLIAMDASQRCRDDREDVVSNQGHAEREQGGLRMAQRVDFRMEMLLKSLKGSFDLPSTAIQLCDVLCSRRRLREVRQDAEFRLAVPCRFLERNPDQSILGRCALIATGYLDRLLVDGPRFGRTNEALRTKRGVVQSLVMATQESSPTLFNSREKAAYAEVPVPNPEIPRLDCRQHICKQRSFLRVA